MTITREDISSMIEDMEVRKTLDKPILEEYQKAMDKGLYVCAGLPPSDLLNTIMPRYGVPEIKSTFSSRGWESIEIPKDITLLEAITVMEGYHNEFMTGLNSSGLSGGPLYLASRLIKFGGLIIALLMFTEGYHNGFGE